MLIRDERTRRGRRAGQLITKADRFGPAGRGCAEPDCHGVITYFPTWVRLSKCS
jgi:hypothetical protein